MTLNRLYYPKTICIANLGDLHYGHAACDRAAVARIVEYIMCTQNLYWVSTGDLLEINIKTSKYYTYDGLAPAAELTELVKLLKPIRHKCLGITYSNHHDRIKTAVGLSIDEILARELNIHVLGEFGMFYVRVGNIGYYICMHHGAGAGRTEGAKANVLERIGDIKRGFDVYLTGHTHSNDYKLREQHIVDRKHQRLVCYPTHYACTGHYLTYDDSYATKTLLRPAPMGSTIITLTGSDCVRHKNVAHDFWTP